MASRRLTGCFLAAALALAACGRDHKPASAPKSGPAPLRRFGSHRVDGHESLEITNEPAAYRITYRVDQAGANLITEEVSVARPFTSETVSRRHNGDVVDVHRLSFGRISTGSPTSEKIVLAVAPAVAATDTRFGASLEDAVTRGLLHAREQREVGDRRCQVYRTGTSIGIALRASDPASNEYADVCIDARGLLLEEWWIVDGHALRQRVATKVVESVPADFGAGWTTAPTSLPVDKGGGSILRMRDDSSPPGERFDVGRVPEGFEHVGRYSVIPPQAEAFSDKGNPYSVVASTVDVWRRGIDAIILEQGGSLGGRKAFNIDPANQSVVIPNIGEVEVVVSPSGSTARALRRNGHFVRVSATLPVDQVLDIVRSLAKSDGTEIVVDSTRPLLPE